jgi:hypothetical protein
MEKSEMVTPMMHPPSGKSRSKPNPGPKKGSRIKSKAGKKNREPDHVESDLRDMPLFPTPEDSLPSWTPLHPPKGSGGP